MYTSRDANAVTNVAFDPFVAEITPMPP
jgi:hypothetical protein